MFHPVLRPAVDCNGDSSLISQSVLPNGVQVFTDTIAGFDSAAVAAFINTGSRHETCDNNGVAHFLEHMAFKGTSTRTARDIAQQIEVLGSNVNAFTSSSMTAYYATGLAENFREATSIIGDVLTDSNFDPSDVALESGVILHEISRSADDPNDVMHDLLKSVAYPSQAFGRTTLGDPVFVTNAKPDDFRDFIGQQYSGETLIVVGAGGIEHEEFVTTVGEAFAKIPAAGQRPAPEPASYQGGIGIDTSRDFRQVSVGIAFPSVCVADDAMYAHRLLASAFGGGMSSPLFTEVRENRGLVYYTSCYASIDVDNGMVAIAGGMTPENLDEFITVACGEFGKLCNTIREIDLRRAKNSALVRLATMHERPFHCGQYIASSLFQRGRIIDVAEVRTQIERVTIDDLKEATRRLVSSEPSISLVGPVPESREHYAAMVRTALGYGS
jgi:predicted Zn-dependent peptidase